ncbi:hypothetical protein ACVXG7_12545 [Enterobacter hormaechei]
MRKRLRQSCSASALSSRVVLLLLTAFNGRFNLFQYLHAGRVGVSGRSKCAQLVGDVLAVLCILLSGNILQGG